MLVLRMLLPAAVFVWLLRAVPIDQLGRSIAQVSPWAFAAAVAVAVGVLGVAGLRWRVLFGACGIRTVIPLAPLCRLHAVGLFYNSYLPGGVGGEFVRALATRGLVGSRGLPGALAIVLLERVLGLSGLLLLVSISAWSFPLGVPNVRFWMTVGGVLALTGVLALIFGSRLTPWLPKPLRRFAEALPTVHSFPRLQLALLLSVVTQSSVIIVGHVVISAIDPQVRLAQSAVIMPLVGASQYFPLTIGGAGVREAAFVAFYGLSGVSPSDALAASLVYAAANYTAAALGGLLHAFVPLHHGLPAVADAPTVEHSVGGRRPELGRGPK